MEELTPPGVAGVAVVRAAIAERHRVLAALRGLATATFTPRPGVPQRAALHLDRVAVDDVLVLDRGVQGLELHLHGSPAVLATVRQHFGLLPAVADGPAAALLRHALGPAQLDLALEQLAFDFAAELAQLAAAARPERRVARAAALARSQHARALTTAARVVLVGQQNAGKSTLFNALVGRERVATGAAPGLTRDPVAETTELAGYPYHVVDTAGEGDRLDGIDAEAVRRSHAALPGGIGVLVVDRSRGPHGRDHELARGCALVVASKADLPAASWPDSLRCDLAVTAAGATGAVLRTSIGEARRCWRGLPPAGPVGGFAALDDAQWAALRAIPE